MQLTLYVPGLFGPGTAIAATDIPHLQNLELLLARARHRAVVPATYHSALGELFGIARAADRDWPVAALTRLVEAGVGASATEIESASKLIPALEQALTPCRSSDPSTSIWIRADPVHLRIDRLGLTLLGAEQVGLSFEESRQLAAQLQQALPPPGRQFEVHAAGRWYLELDRAPEIVTRELDTVLGRDIQQALPAGPERQYWHQFSNEVQMALHELPVNRARERNGRAPINSLWFWGAGALPAVRAVPWTALVGDEPCARGLALHLRVPNYPDPQALPATANTLAIFAGCKQALELGHFESWQNALLQLEQEWLAPFVSRLRKGEIQVLSLRTDGDEFSVTRRDLWRVWRRVRPFSSYLGSGAA